MDMDRKYKIVVDEWMARDFQKFYEAQDAKPIGGILSEEYVKYLIAKKNYKSYEGNRAIQLENK